MAFSDDQIKALSAPLDRSVVKTNPKGHSYVEAYHAENEANRIFGFDAWDRTDDVHLIGEALKKDKYGNDQHWVYYRCKVRITVRTPGGAVVIREGQGYGSGIDKDLGQAHESALKEAESDAEKRALKTFGNPFGQALYDKTQANVAEAPAGPAPWLGAEEAAINVLRGASGDPDLFRETWGKNKAGWRDILPDESYARVVGVMKECGAVIAKQQAEVSKAVEAFRGGRTQSMAPRDLDDPRIAQSDDQIPF